MMHPVLFETISKDIYGLFVGFCERYIAAVSARIYRYMVFTFYIASQDDILARQKILRIQNDNISNISNRILMHFIKKQINLFVCHKNRTSLQIEKKLIFAM